jgi:uncharacterized protein (TIGR03382 family)
MTAEALAGPEPCREAACGDTTRWLCDTYGYCGQDGGADAAPKPAAAGHGCAVTGGAPGVAPLLLAAFALLRTRRRRP